MPKEKQLVDVNGFKVRITNLNKILYPTAKIIKAEIIQYYLEIAPWMLLFAKDRPISMLRFPDGILAHQFYSKNAPDWKPDWMITTQLPDDEINYILIQGAQDLAWLANIASLENHAMNKRMSDKLHMDHIIFDFDPPEQFDYQLLRDLTVDIGMFLEEKGLPSYVKTSGSRGAHIYIPIQETMQYDLVIREIKLLAKAIVKQFPKQTTSVFRKDQRNGKILVDINRNFDAQTTILPFSTRAREHAPVSMPLTWSDFSKTTSSQDYTIKNAKKYLEKNGYAWSDFRQKAIDFAKVEKSLNTASITPAASKNEIKLPTWFSEVTHRHMLAGVCKAVPKGKNYVFENKWDGIRVFIYIHLGRCRIISRNGHDISANFPKIVESAIKDRTLSAVIDGELIVVDELGRPEFSRIISRLHSKSRMTQQLRKNPVVLYAFDILRLDGKEVTSEKWHERRQLLKTTLKEKSNFRLSESVIEGDLLREAAKSMDLEGIMIKRVDGIYREGVRSDAWQKLKFRTEVDCVILGFTAGAGDRSNYFGSLHVAEVDEDQLIYRGKVGTGFDGKMLQAYSTFFKKLSQGSKVIAEKVEEENRSTWFDKSLPFCEIRYARLTKNGTFREPVFVKMKEKLYEI